MSDDRRSRDIDILRKAAQDRPRAAKGGPQAQAGAGGQILYRGKPVSGRGSGGRAPGAPAPQQRAAAPADGGDGDVKAALQKLTTLFNDGLITSAEFDAKRAEILDRL